MQGESHGHWYYQQVELGFNYRMTELQAALGVSQMRRVEQFVSARHTIAERYNALLADLPLTLPFQLENTYSGLHLYVVRLQLNKLSISHRDVFEQLRERGIGVNLHYIPVHTQPYYQNMGFQIGDFPAAEAYYEEAISLPMFHVMTRLQQDEVVSSLKAVLDEGQQ
jgi:dTDP-4-amino-4,6-dideoxygalactose transaminase